MRGYQPKHSIKPKPPKTDSRARAPVPEVTVLLREKELDDYTPFTKAEAQKDDPVNHPSHYTSGKIEVIDYIEDQKLGYHLGNAVKYISRAGKKDPAKTAEDLKKAIWYIERKIKELEAQA